MADAHGAGGGGHPIEVVRWRRRPLWWMAMVVLIGGLLLLLASSDTKGEERLATQGYLVEGRILPSWDGGSRIPVQFRNPKTGEAKRAYAVFGGVDRPVRVGPARLRVNRDDSGDVRLDGPPGPGMDWSGGGNAVVWPAAVCGAWWLARRRRVGRDEAQLALGGPRLRALAIARPGRFRRRSWRLYLYPPDAQPGVAPTGRVRVIGSTHDPRPFSVELTVGQGPARNTLGNGLAVRQVHDGRVWWPARSAHSTTSGPRLPAFDVRTDLCRRSRWGWMLLVLGIASVVTGRAIDRDPIHRLALNTQVVRVTVLDSMDRAKGPVSVAYRLGGRDRTATVRLAGPQREGDRFELAADRTRPTVLWQPNTELAPVSEDNFPSDAATTAGVLSALMGLVVLRRPVRGATREERLRIEGPANLAPLGGSNAEGSATARLDRPPPPPPPPPSRPRRTLPPPPVSSPTAERPDGMLVRRGDRPEPAIDDPARSPAPVDLVLEAVPELPPMAALPPLAPLPPLEGLDREEPPRA